MYTPGGLGGPLPDRIQTTKLGETPEQKPENKTGNLGTHSVTWFESVHNAYEDFMDLESSERTLEQFLEMVFIPFFTTEGYETWKNQQEKLNQFYNQPSITQPTEGMQRQADTLGSKIDTLQDQKIAKMTDKAKINQVLPSGLGLEQSTIDQLQKLDPANFDGYEDPTYECAEVAIFVIFQAEISTDDLANQIRLLPNSRENILSALPSLTNTLKDNINIAFKNNPELTKKLMDRVDAMSAAKMNEIEKKLQKK